MQKRLIVNADDLGLSRGITDGIFLAHCSGIVTSASLMVNQPATEYALEQLQRVPGLDVGIHLNLCQGKPVLPASSVRSLVGADGDFLAPREMGRRLMLWQVSPREIEAEFVAQIDRMLSLGLTPSHADSHHRFHMYPAAAAPFYRAVRSRGIARARAPRKVSFSTDGDSGLGAPHAGGFCRRLAVTMYNGFLQSVVFRDLTLPDAGVALPPRFRRRQQSLPDAWKTTLENLLPGTYEMWCHPGFAQRGFSESDPLSRQRELEITILTDPCLRETVEHAGIQLTNFRYL